MLIDFEAFQERGFGFHIADQDAKEIYCAGTAHGYKFLPSFAVCGGAIRL